MTDSVETYLLEGCGRCPLGCTPDCKVHQWREELDRLRDIVLNCGLNEQVKWGVPCYNYMDKNVMLLSAFKNYCCISFFKGVLLSERPDILVKQGNNSQAARLIKFTSARQVKEIEKELKACIYEAIEVEKAGLKVRFKKNPEPIPIELEKRFEEDPVFKSAFESLSPGRQRGYIIHFSGAKQSTTRVSRIEKSISKILKGEGMHDKYTARKK